MSGPRVTPFVKAGPTLAGFLPSSGFSSGVPSKMLTDGLLDHGTGNGYEIIVFA
jgi:hypothetical protein